MKTHSKFLGRFCIGALGLALFLLWAGSAEAGWHVLTLVNAKFGDGTTSKWVDDSDNPVIYADAAPAGQEFDQWSPSSTRYLDGINNPITRFDMPNNNITITATYKAIGPPTHYLNVHSSGSDGNYANGAIVNIVANAPASGKVFDRWTIQAGADVSMFGNIYNSTTTFVMPNNDAEITATYKDAPAAHYLDVHSGGPDNWFMAGTNITITANAPAAGKVFDHWQINEGADASMFASLYVSPTIFTMPNNDVDIRAIYRDAVGHWLHVIHSDSDATNVFAGTVRTIVISPSAGQAFSYWQIDSGATAAMFGSLFASPTTFTMPDNDVQITGIYTNIDLSPHNLTISGGTVDGTNTMGSYSNAVVVNITANPPPAGQIFERWTGADAGRFGNVNSASTTFVMPATDVTLVPVYINVYDLTVNSGSGDGTYTNGTRVNIAADAPAAGQVFDQWSGAVASQYGSIYAANTIFTMASNAATITATYSNGVATTTTTTIPSALERTYALVSVGTAKGEGRVVTVTGMRRKTWAQYALWSDYNGQIYFKAGEKFYGLVHSNSKLWFSGDPEFFKRVSQSTNGSGGSFGYGGSTNSVIFHEGYITNAPVGSMASVTFTNMKNKADLVVTGTTSITMSGTNLFIKTSATNFTYGLKESTVIAICTSGGNNGDVSIGGQLDGRVTIVAERDILITNHLTYAVDPATNTACNDALGLIANRDIVVTTVAPNSLKVYAHMMATGNLTPSDDTDGSFGVENYNTRAPSGQLTVWGGIVQNERGAVGTFSGSTLSSGFDKNYRYDERFAVDPPPEYPTLSDQLMFDKWRDQ